MAARAPVQALCGATVMEEPARAPPEDTPLQDSTGLTTATRTFFGQAPPAVQAHIMTPGI